MSKTLEILIGGSPCTKWSIAQKNDRETEPQGEGWELFKNYLIAKERFRPDLFLYENNKSTAKPIKDQISKELRAPLQYINSALVSAQRRERFYAHNFGDVPQPEDRGIVLQDILESGGVRTEKTYALAEPVRVAEIGASGGQGQRVYSVDAKAPAVRAGGRMENIAVPCSVVCPIGATIDGKAYALKANYYKSSVANFVNGGGHYPQTGAIESTSDSTKEHNVYRVDDGQIEIKGQKYPTKLPDGYYIIRKLTVTEACRLQTLPDDYCRAVSATQAYKGLGNGWTAEVIIHLLKHGLAGVPKDEEIVVLSMYDGIGTGRYSLDKMGYTNVTYYAYEIDKYAKQIAMSNYPDIIQCGDAFDVRAQDWFLAERDEIAL